MLYNNTHVLHTHARTHVRAHARAYERACVSCVECEHSIVLRERSNDGPIVRAESDRWILRIIELIAPIKTGRRSPGFLCTLFRFNTPKLSTYVCANDLEIIFFLIRRDLKNASSYCCFFEVILIIFTCILSNLHCHDDNVVYWHFFSRIFMKFLDFV